MPLSCYHHPSLVIAGNQDPFPALLTGAADRIKPCEEVLAFTDMIKPCEAVLAFADMLNLTVSPL